MSVEIVRKVKETLESFGDDLSGPCGAYRITEAVAGYLNVGVLSKPSGNNCEGNAVDQLCYRDGGIRDILGDAGGANTPQWPDVTEFVDPSRYVPVPTWSFPEQPPEGPQEPVEDHDDLALRVGSLERQITSLRASNDSLEQLVQVLATNTAREIMKDRVRTDSLESRLSNPVQTSRMFGHSHKVVI